MQSSTVRQASRSTEKPVPIKWDNVRLSEAMQSTLRFVRQSKLHEKISVYEGFGSFHSANVEDLITMKDSEYAPPRNLPAFAKRILTNDQLRQLTLMKWHSDSSEARDRHTASTPLSGHKRTRPEAAVLRSSLSTNTNAAGNFPPAQHQAALPTVPSTNTSSSENDASSGADDIPCPTSESGDGCPDPAILIADHLSHGELLECLAAAPQQPCAMGREFGEKYFLITPEVTFINHGAFGSSLSGATTIKRYYEEMMEREVVDFVDRELLPLIVYSIRSLSRFLHADPRQVILLQNATFALNCAMQLIEKDDVVAFLDTEYLSVYKMMWFRCQEVGASHHELALSRFLHDEAVMGNDVALAEEIVRQLPAGCTTVIVDYITSTSALCLPVFSQIIPALRRHGVTKIIVDGAHCPLQVDLNFAALPPESQPTVFVGNLHKWFSSPKSVGFFWVRAEDADSMHSVVLSHGAGDGLLSEFIWDGTRDYGAYLSVPALVDFWEAQGVDRVRAYCTSLLESAAAMLTAAFRSRLVARHSPFMSLVELPEELQDDYVTAKYIQDLLHDVYHIEVPVKRVEGRYYLRVSAFVYNTPQEYVFLKEAVLDIADRWFHSAERRAMALEATRQAHLREQKHQQQSSEGGADAAALTAGEVSNTAAPPCDERIRRQGGCGVSGLEPSLKRKKTHKF